MKNIKSQRIITLMALVVFAFYGCGNDTGNHSHKWEWVLTQEGSVTEERMETETCSCGETGNTRSVPIEREKTITVAINGTDFQNCLVAVEGNLTLKDLTTFTDKLIIAINAGFEIDLGDPFLNAAKEDQFGNVFKSSNGGIVKIIIENNEFYTLFKAVNKKTLKLNIDYLLTATANDLRDKIIAAVSEMDNLPIN